MTDLVVVGGSVTSLYRNGGHPWELFSWARGFRRLGLDVFVVDQLYRALCVHADGSQEGFESCLNVPYGLGAASFFGFEEAYAIVGDGGEDVSGLTHAELAELVADAIAFVNISGTVTSEIKRKSRCAIYVDTDPGLTHLWLASGERAPRVEGHELHFTIVSSSSALCPGSSPMWSSGPWGPEPRSVASVVNLSLGPPVVTGQSSSTTGWRVWRQSMPPVGSDEAGVPTFSPIVKWSSWPSTRGARSPEASQRCVRPGSVST